MLLKVNPVIQLSKMMQPTKIGVNLLLHLVHIYYLTSDSLKEFKWFNLSNSEVEWVKYVTAKLHDRLRIRTVAYELSM